MLFVLALYTHLLSLIVLLQVRALTYTVHKIVFLNKSIVAPPSWQRLRHSKGAENHPRGGKSGNPAGSRVGWLQHRAPPFLHITNPGQLSIARNARHPLLMLAFM